MASLKLISLVLSFIGTFCGPFGAEAALGGYQLGDRRSVAGLGSRKWLTAESFSRHMSESDGYRNTFAPIDTGMPIDAGLWEFMPPPEHFLANWIKFHEERKDWRRRQRQEAQHGDLTPQRQLPPHESELELGHREERRLPIHLFKIHGFLEGAHEGAGQLQRLSGNAYHSNESGGRKHRAKRSCVLRRVDRFLRRVQMITGRGVLGELIRLAGGLRGDLQFYRILPNEGGARGVGVSLRAGTANWRGFRSGVPYLGIENSRGRGATTAGRSDGYLNPGWNEAPRGETTLGAVNYGGSGVSGTGTNDGYVSSGLDGAPSGEANLRAENSGGIGVASGGDGAMTSGSNGVPSGETNNLHPSGYGRRGIAGSNAGSGNEYDTD